MPAWLAKLFSSGTGDVIGKTFEAIDKVHTSAEERNEAKARVLTAVVDSKVRLIEADSKSGGLAAQWRPAAALSFVAMLWWYALTPALELPPPDLTQVPDKLWAFLFGYGTYREAGKMVDRFQSRRMMKMLAKLKEMKGK